MEIRRVTFPPTGKTIPFHECAGTAERMFELESGAVEVWTWCAECGNWWQSAYWTAEALEHVRRMFEVGDKLTEMDGR